MKQIVQYYEVQGTNEEIGKKLAKRQDAMKSYLPTPEFFKDEDLEEALNLYSTYCPGIREEIISFAKELNIQVKDIAYTWMTYLIPRCSGAIILGSQMKDGHTRIARNYELGIGDEETALCQTKVKGRYAHIGSTAAVFGRSDGINECGLAVAMSSCGIPVSNFEKMRPATTKGLQFWAVIRSLLENCKDVDEALKSVMEMPIAFNLNLYLADASGQAVLFESINGEKAYRKINEHSKQKSIYGTNHTVLPELIKHESVAMRNSIVRYEALKKFLNTKERLNEEQIKTFFLSKYPEGMTLYCYPQWFGTIRTVILDTVERRYSICWFGQTDNGWEDYRVHQPILEREEEKIIQIEQGTPDLFESILIRL